MLQLRPRIDELQAFLNNSKDTLQGWLKENKKGMGREYRQNCVMRAFYGNGGFFPQITIEGGNSFYGISINLDSIHRPIKSIDDYTSRKKTVKNVWKKSLLPCNASKLKGRSCRNS